MGAPLAVLVIVVVVAVAAFAWGFLTGVRFGALTPDEVRRLTDEDQPQ